jgi:glycosyltransferase involved in cell wall biosynthesis
MAEALDASYWLTGPAEEDYADDLARILETAQCPVYRAGPGVDDMHLAYAAADAVVFPSTWEGFGLPVIEAAFARRPIAVGAYPVATELWQAGLRWFPADDPQPLRAWLAAPDHDVLARNYAVAAWHFSIEAVVEQLAALVRSPSQEPAHAVSGARV